MLIKAELLLEMLILTVLWQVLQRDFQVLGEKREYITTADQRTSQKRIPVTSLGALA